MASDTKINLRGQMIYQVFPRQYSKTHDFKGVTADMSRIKALGADILYLLPIHPIGQINRKGSVGSPYAIKNYRGVNPDYGTLDDFKELLQKAHQHGLKVMIDVVFNHTSPDSHLAITHPEWFYRDENLQPIAKNPDWWDIVDLDFTHKDLWHELIDTLCYWAKLGVDGYRCDVASLLPKSFWLETRKALKSINPDFLLLAESIDLNYIKWMRNNGFNALTDSECYEAFDILYDYDIFYLYQAYLRGKGSLNAWLEALRQQDARYPVNYLKAHALDNHDQERAAKFFKGSKLINLVALNSFLRGVTFIYAGDEACNTYTPTLFEIEEVDFTTLNQNHIADLIAKMSVIKKDNLCIEGAYDIFLEESEVAHIEYWNKHNRMIGLFNLSDKKVELSLKNVDGEFSNLINDEKIIVNNGNIDLEDKPIIIKI